MNVFIMSYLIVLFTLIISFIYVCIKMKNSFKKVLLLITLILLILGPPTWLIIQLTPEHVSEASMIKTFNNNIDRFNIVAQYMVSYGEGTHILYDDGIYKIGYFSDYFDSQAKEIIDETAKDEIKYILKKLKYKFIYYSGNYVSFARTTDNLGRSQKLIYVVNPKDFEISEDVKIKLIQDNWYYWGR